MFKSSLSWLCKLLKMDSSRLPKICFSRLLALSKSTSDGDAFNWTSQIKTFFILSNKEDLWPNLNVNSLLANRTEILLSLKDKLRLSDLNRVSTSSYPYLYHKLVLQDNIQPYLTFLKPIFITRIIAQIRTSSKSTIKFTHKGTTHVITAIDNCSICNLSEAETIFHILARCPIYQEFRTPTLNTLKHPDDLIQLLNTLSVNEAADIAFFIINSLNIRSFILEQ